MKTQQSQLIRLVLAVIAVHCPGHAVFAADAPIAKSATTAPTANAYLLPSVDEPLLKKLSLSKAAESLDRTALAWVQSKKCGSCHTGWPYLMSRAVLREEPAPALTEIRKFFEGRMTNWDADEKVKKHQHREIVGTSTALAIHDSQTTGKLQPVTREALDRMWTFQRKDGAWNWPKCSWPPFEIDDYYGAVMAAVGVGQAPENYARGDSAKAGVEKLRDYFKNTAPPSLHHKTWLLWASVKLDGLLSTAGQETTIKELLALQRSDGGWSMESLGNGWVGREGEEANPDAPSDGYGTGLVVYVLRQAGVPANHESIQRGKAWLTTNQRESGRWFTRSLNGVKQHYLSDTGTVFAVLALDSCADADSKVDKALGSGPASPLSMNADALRVVAVLRDESALAGAHDIEIRDGLAYIAGKGFTRRNLPNDGVFPYEAGKGGSLAIVDVKQPASPKVLWSANTPLAYEDAETVLPLDGHRLLAGTRDLFMFDVSDRANPKQLAAIKDRPRVDTINGFARLGNAVFGANKEGHIFAVDVSAPNTIKLLGSRETRENGELSSPHDAAFCGDLLVIVSPEGFGSKGRPGRLGVYRVADAKTRKVLPTGQWSLVGRLEHPRLAGANRVMTRDTFAYVGSSLSQSGDRTDDLRSNVAVIELSDPANPRLRGSMDFPDARGPNGLEIAGTVVFAAGGQTVQAIDVSAPEMPKELGRLTAPAAFPGGADDAHDLVFVDGHLFVTAQTSHSLVVVRFKDAR